MQPDLIKRAREEELEEFKKKNVYVKVPIEECFEKTGRKPISIKWVYVNKGDDRCPNYRARLVARQMEKWNEASDAFAGTPPLEAKKMLFSLAATKHRHEGTNEEVEMELSFIDIRRAYFNADVKEDMYIDLLEEDAEAGYCGKLIKSMYGTKQAARNW